MAVRYTYHKDTEIYIVTEDELFVSGPYDDEEEAKKQLSVYEQHFPEAKLKIIELEEGALP